MESKNIKYLQKKWWDELKKWKPGFRYGEMTSRTIAQRKEIKSQEHSNTMEKKGGHIYVNVTLN